MSNQIMSPDDFIGFLDAECRKKLDAVKLPAGDFTPELKQIAAYKDVIGWIGTYRRLSHG